MFHEVLSEARQRAGLSQEKLAEKLSVSRQAVQKWENGEAMPDLHNLISVAEFFDISLDYLLRGKDLRSTEALRTSHEVLPAYDKAELWGQYCDQLLTEFRQSTDEGLDISAYGKLFEAADAMPAGREKSELADILFRIVRKAPVKSGYPYEEPSGLEEIRSLSGPFPVFPAVPDRNSLEDRILGGWLGRICGCFLGKPVEGIRTRELHLILKRTGNFPLRRYLSREEMTPEVTKDIAFPIAQRAYPSDLGRMPADDDTNYVVLAQRIIEKSGRNFSSADVGKAWLRSQPKTAYCTAECVAYRNLVNGYLPPQTAVFQNPYREWIGAQIRGDYFGYINPCDPSEAAEMAWRDARISHIKNGIYGEMWVSAMIACAFGCSSPAEAIRGGLCAVPKTSRLFRSVSGILAQYEKGVSCEACMASVAAEWNENDSYDWCHTVSNAEIVAASLLYGNMDYGRTVCLAVSQGFDTDCNGATAGSVLGVLLGAAALPEEWTGRVNDTLETMILGVGTVSIRGMAEKTMKHLKS